MLGGGKFLLGVMLGMLAASAAKIEIIMARASFLDTHGTFLNSVPLCLTCQAGLQPRPSDLLYWYTVSLVGFLAE